jgi:hypothetical protein
MRIKLVRLRRVNPRRIKVKVYSVSFDMGLEFKRKKLSPGTKRWLRRMRDLGVFD